MNNPRRINNYVNVALGVPVDFPGVKLRPAR